MRSRYHRGSSDSAFVLTWGKAERELLVSVLVREHYERIYRFVNIFLGSGEKAHKTARQTIREAVDLTISQDRSQYQGQTSVRAWLFKIALQNVRSRKKESTYLDRILSYLPTWKRTPYEISAKSDQIIQLDKKNKILKLDSKTILIESIENLPEKPLLLLLLYYLEELEIEEIAYMLEYSSEKLQHILNQIQVQSINSNQIHVVLNKQKETTESSKSKYQQNPLNSLDNKTENRLRNLLSLHWTPPNLQTVHFENIASKILSSSDSEKHKRIRFPLSPELALIGGILISIIVLLNIYNQPQSEHSGTIPFSNPSILLPTAISGTYDEFNQILTPGNQNSRTILYKMPNISANGRWITYASSDNFLVEKDNNGVDDIFVFDTLNKTTERVSLSSNGVEANGRSFAPSISENGRWVVFVSRADNLVPQDSQLCPPNSPSGANCSDVFVRDLERSITEKITIGYDGSEATGDSYNPVISGNGLRIAFWSEAENLIPTDEKTCSEKCLDLFIFERDTGLIRHVPIGRERDHLSYLHDLSISWDGNRIVLTIEPTDQIAQDLPLSNQTEMFVYEIKTRAFEPISINSDGIPGNGPASHASISRDGRFVAFASPANNLVENDKNGKADVYVRDLELNKTERISISNSGEEGNGNSGIYKHIGNNHVEKIGVSGNGRYVLFVSEADNLTSDAVPCSATNLESKDCQYIYTYDRKLNKTYLLHSNTQGESLLMFTDISADGRNVVFMEQLFDCIAVCSNIWLYDRITGILEDVGNADPEVLATPLKWVNQKALRGHDGSVHSVTFSPDGVLFATAANDSFVQLWLGENGTALYQLGNTMEGVTSLAFSPTVISRNRENKRYMLATGSSDGTVTIWEVSNSFGKRLYRLRDHPGSISSLAFSPNGKLLAVGSANGVWLWELRADTMALVHKYPGDDVANLAFSPDGRFLATTSDEKTIWIWKILEGIYPNDIVLRLGAHDNKVLTVAFSPSGKFLATGSEDERVNLWQLRYTENENLQATLSRTFQLHDRIRSATFSPDGNFLAIGGEDDGLHLWNLTNGDLVRFPFRMPRYRIFSIAFSPNGNTIAAGAPLGLIHFLQTEKSVEDLKQPTEDTFKQNTQFFEPINEESVSSIEIKEGLENAESSSAAQLSLPQNLLNHYQLSNPYDLLAPLDLALTKAYSVGHKRTSARILSLLYETIFRGNQVIKVSIHLPLDPNETPDPADFPVRRVAEKAEIEQLSFMGVQAEYIQGGWAVISENTVAVEEKTAPLGWSSKPSIQTLRWIYNGILFEISTAPLSTENQLDETDLLTQSDLISMAEQILIKSPLTKNRFHSP